MSNQLNHFLADDQLDKKQLLALIELAIKIKIVQNYVRLTEGLQFTPWITN